MKRRLAVLIVILMSLVFILTSISAEFWASINSNKYHYPSCKWAQKINPRNLVKFNSPEQAQKAGFLPCKVCRPPVSSKAELKINDGLNLASLRTLSNGLEKRGCCSWHSGVCGCQNGRIVCCDGTHSPTCTCKK